MKREAIVVPLARHTDRVAHGLRAGDILEDLTGLPLWICLENTPALDPKDKIKVLGFETWLVYTVTAEDVRVTARAIDFALACQHYKKAKAAAESSSHD